MESEQEERRERENRRNGNYESREREKGKRHCSSGTLIGLVRTIMGLPLLLSSGSLTSFVLEKYLIVWNFRGFTLISNLERVREDL